MGQHQRQARSWTGRSGFRDEAGHMIVAASEQSRSSGDGCALIAHNQQVLTPTSPSRGDLEGHLPYGMSLSSRCTSHMWETHMVLLPRGRSTFK